MNVLSPAITLNREAETSSLQNDGPEVMTQGNDLLKRCINNDRAAQEQLYKKYYGKMMATCMRYLGNRDDAMEVLNLGFLKVFQNLQKFDGKGSFDGWVYRIIRNNIIDHLRSKIRYREMEGGSLDDMETMVAESATENLYAKDLLQMLNILPETSRLVFNMFALEGFKHEEIANVLSISVGTSKWHVSEARRILKIQLEKERNP